MDRDPEQVRRLPVKKSEPARESPIVTCLSLSLFRRGYESRRCRAGRHRETDEHTLVVDAVHEGYADSAGIIHRRVRRGIAVVHEAVRRASGILVSANHQPVVVRTRLPSSSTPALSHF